MTRKTIEQIKNHDSAAQPLVCLTAYTARIAEILDAHCDLLLVGDSMGMVLYGLDSTRGVTLDMMINHGQAVMRGSDQACVIVDLPFGTYEDSAEQALASARRVMDEVDCQAVKLEGGADFAPTIRAIVDAGIPVVGHVGLMPQSVTEASGFRVKGRDEDVAAQLIEDVKAVEAAGASAVVIEATIESVAEAMSAAVSIPTIGIGASAKCDGQILVTEDMLGITGDHVPKFVKQYAHVSQGIEAAVAGYATDVRARKFPEDAQVYKAKKAS